MKDQEKYFDILSKAEFEVGTPGIFFKCESAVFIKDGTNSLCYTTSGERSEVLAAVLNDWVRMRKAEKAK